MAQVFVSDALVSRAVDLAEFEDAYVMANIDLLNDASKVKALDSALDGFHRRFDEALTRDQRNDERFMNTLRDKVNRKLDKRKNERKALMAHRRKIEKQDALEARDEMRFA